MEGTTQELVSLNGRDEGCSLELVEGGVREVTEENLGERKPEKIKPQINKSLF